MLFNCQSLHSHITLYHTRNKYRIKVLDSESINFCVGFKQLIMKISYILGYSVLPTEDKTILRNRLQLLDGSDTIYYL